MILIEHATIVDGTGAEPVQGWVTIDGDRIVDIGEGAAPDGADERIDGTGLVLAPGFVDVHTHDDAAVIAAPDHACKTLQGVTSVVVGNCGISPAPASDHTPGFTVHESMAAYFDAVEEAQPAVNIAALAGHGTIRAKVMGLRNEAAATDDELAAMLDYLREAFAAGAIGFSSGLAYEPGRYSPPAELQAFAEVAGTHGGIYTTHMRNEGDDLLASIDECIDVAEQTGIPLQISHLKAAGRTAWGLATQALERIDAARERGVDVMADQYPYTRGSTLLEQIVNGGALDGPSAFGQVEPEQVLVAAAPRTPEWEGRTLAEIAELEDEAPRTMADRIVEVEGRGCIIVLDMMSEEDVCTVMTHPAVMIGTDGVPAGNKPHPRLGHTYPRILGRYVREQGLLELADAVRRMTSVPAQRFGFVDRGELRPGAFADLVLLDPEAVLDTGTWTEPTVPPAGIIGVWVNGQRVVDGQAVTGARPGRTIRARR